MQLLFFLFLFGVVSSVRRTVFLQTVLDDRRVTDASPLLIYWSKREKLLFGL